MSEIDTKTMGMYRSALLSISLMDNKTARGRRRAAKCSNQRIDVCLITSNETKAVIAKVTARGKLG